MTAARAVVSPLRNEKEQVILRAAEREFEAFGFGGARLQHIADLAGVPKANVHYYFASKQDLYNAVLTDIVALWDQTFESIDVNDDPTEVLTNFVRMKVEFARLYPRASRIFASEIIHGAPHLSKRLNEDMNRWTNQRAAVIGRWVELGKIAPVDPYHLIFLIWASTQHYANASAQVASIRGKERLTRDDFEHVADSLTTMVLRICGLEKQGTV